MKQQKLDHVIDLRTAKRHVLSVDIQPQAAHLVDMAADLGVLAISKLKFQTKLRPIGKSDWELQAHLGATVQQPCRISHKPVTTRIEVAVHRRYLDALSHQTYDAETQMTDDDTCDPLPRQLDLFDVICETLSLEIPDYPTHRDAKFEQLSAHPPGATPITDQDTKPFAKLATLKDALKNGQNKL